MSVLDLQARIKRLGLTDIERAALMVAIQRFGEAEGLRVEARRAGEWRRCLAQARASA